MRARRSILVLLGVLLLSASFVPAGAGSVPQPSARRLKAALRDLVDDPNGPRGAIVVIHRGSNRRVFTSGVANVETGAAMRSDMHMRIASTSKAYSGGVALSLVQQGALSLDDTVADLLPWAPPDWGEVTLGQALHHTSGLPDYTADLGFLDYFADHLEDPLPPRQLLGYAGDELDFDAGTQYQYSNSDNIVVGLMVKAATGRRYERELTMQVRKPLGLLHTSLPRGVEMPRPYIRGYQPPGNPPEDVSELAAAGYAWASGGIVSTPGDQDRFVRGYIGRDLFDRTTQQAQFDFIPGDSDPPGPGDNHAGLAVFRYSTSCGTMYGHTGSIFGYTQFIAASRDGRRSVVVSVNRQTTPTVAPAVFEKLQRVFRLGVCAAMSGSR
ncbi:MAG: serine hydrolase domain-containing protein [Actinomycetota bacterium]